MKINHNVDGEVGEVSKSQPAFRDKVRGSAFTFISARVWSVRIPDYRPAALYCMFHTYACLNANMWPGSRMIAYVYTTILAVMVHAAVSSQIMMSQLMDTQVAP